MILENIKVFINPAYLFTPYPSPDTKYMIPFLVFFGVSVILSLVSFFIAKKRKKKKKPSSLVFAYIYNWLFWTGIIGLALMFFRYEEIGFLSMRFILLIWLITFVVWGIFIAFFYFKGYKKILKEFNTEKSKQKYFIGRRNK